MNMKATWVGALSAVLWAGTVLAADVPAVPKLGAAEIVERNVAARGGLEAWRAVNTLTMSGRLEAGGKTNAELPFVMRMKRPHMSRLELRFQNQTAVQVYDGSQGWKWRPFLGRNQVEPFTADESKSAANWDELDGPLMNYAAKGTRVAADGVEMVEGSPAYRLKLTMKSGAERRLWVDAKTFLEVKIDGEPRKFNGKMRPVTVWYRDFRREGALNMPHVLVTQIDGVQPTHKMSIDRIAVNESFADDLFAAPKVAMAKAAP
jgi:hypothetical protein